MNKQVRGKILMKRTTMHIEHMKLSRSRDSFLKHVRGNDHKKKAEERYLGSAEVPPCAPQRNAELLEPIPYKFMA